MFKRFFEKDFNRIFFKFVFLFHFFMLGILFLISSVFAVNDLFESYTTKKELIVIAMLFLTYLSLTATWVQYLVLKSDYLKTGKSIKQLFLYR